MMNLLARLLLGLVLCLHATRADEVKLTLQNVSAQGIVPDATATDLMPFKIYNFSVHSMAFSPDGKTLATGDGHGDLRLWDTVNGALLTTLSAHTGWCFSVAWLKDGKTVATGGKDRLIQFRDFRPPFREPFQTLKTFRGHTGDVHAVALTADNATLASAGDDKTIRIWDVAEARTVKTLVGHERQIPTLALSPDGELIASGSRDQTIRFWEVKTGNVTALLAGHKGDVMAVKFSPDGQTLASGSYDQTVRLWDVKTQAPLNVLTGHTFRVYSVAFSPDGKRLASAGDKTARVWAVPGGERLRTFTLEAGIQTGQEAVPGSVSVVAYNPDGRQLAIGTTLGSVLLVDAETGAVLHTLTPPPPVR